MNFVMKNLERLKWMFYIAVSLIGSSVYFAMNSFASITLILGIAMVLKYTFKNTC